MPPRQQQPTGKHLASTIVPIINQIVLLYAPRTRARLDLEHRHNQRWVHHHVQEGVSTVNQISDLHRRVEASRAISSCAGSDICYER